MKPEAIHTPPLDTHQDPLLMALAREVRSSRPGQNCPPERDRDEALKDIPRGKASEDLLNHVAACGECRRRLRQVAQPSFFERLLESLHGLWRTYGLPLQVGATALCVMVVGLRLRSDPEPTLDVRPFTAGEVRLDQRHTRSGVRGVADEDKVASAEPYFIQGGDVEVSLRLTAPDPVRSAPLPVLALLSVADSGVVRLLRPTMERAGDSLVIGPLRGESLGSEADGTIRLVLVSAPDSVAMHDSTPRLMSLKSTDIPPPRECRRPSSLEVELCGLDLLVKLVTTESGGTIQGGMEIGSPLTPASTPADEE